MSRKQKKEMQYDREKLEGSEARKERRGREEDREIREKIGRRRYRG